MSVLVTGAGGFTGGALARRLVADGIAVRGSVRPGGDTGDLERLGVEVVQGDVRSGEDVRRMVEGCSTVYHIAALFRRAGVPDAEYTDVNVEGTRHLLEASMAAGVERFVHCSTIGVCGHIAQPPGTEETPYNPGDIYQRTKMEGEKLALEYFRDGRVKGAVVRPASIYGPGDLRLLKLFRMIKKQRFVRIGDGKPHFHTVYIDDLVEGFLLAARTDAACGEVFIIASAEHVPLNELFTLIADVLGVPPPRWRVPALPVQWLAGAVERVCIPLRIEPPIYRRRVDFFTKNRAFDIAKARKVLGYEPRTSLRQGLENTARWYQDKGLI